MITGTTLAISSSTETKSAPGIVKAWSNILEIMGYMAILVNLAVLVITFDMELGNKMLVTQNVTFAEDVTIGQGGGDVLTVEWLALCD